MNMRSSRSVVTFSRPFSLAGFPDTLPSGKYEIIVEEELLQGLSFQAYRRTATYMAIHGAGGRPDRTELRKVTETDLERALSRDRDISEDATISTTARAPREDQK